VNPKVLYMTYDGLTDPLGRSQILPYLIGLSRFNYAVHVLSFEKYGKEKEIGIVKQICKESGITWTPLAYHKSPLVISTVYDLFILRKVTFSLLKKQVFDIIHCRSYLTALIGSMVQKNYRIKFIFDMRGFWADERIEGNIWSKSNPVYKLIYGYFKGKEKELIQKADHVVVLTEKARQILKAWGRNYSVTVIPCCADTAFFNPDTINAAEQSQFRSKLGIADSAFVLGYIGSISTWYLLDEMLQFFETLVSMNNEARFLFITPDPEEQILQKANQIGIAPGKLIVRKAQRDEMPLYISIADFTLIFIKNTFSKQGSSATKLGESLAMGVPALANAGVGDNDLLFHDARIGVLIERLDPEEYRVAAKKLLDWSANREQVRCFALRHLSLDQGIRRYANVYNEVLNGALILK
jgi:glycosyltransferase involved in cell wall biosynthesis